MSNPTRSNILIEHGQQLQDPLPTQQAPSSGKGSTNAPGKVANGQGATPSQVRSNIGELTELMTGMASVVLCMDFCMFVPTKPVGLLCGNIARRKACPLHHLPRVHQRLDRPESVMMSLRGADISQSVALTLLARLQGSDPLSRCLHSNTQPLHLHRYLTKASVLITNELSCCRPLS